MPVQIRTAYAIGRKGGTHYRARAYAVSDFGPCSFTVAIDDTPDAATARAIEYVRDAYRRDGLPVPETVEECGRMPGPLVDNFKF